MELIIGTAQMGMDYGVSNREGKVSESEAVKMLFYANCNGINTIDTASCYGDSHKVIGLYAGQNAKIITKTGNVFDHDYFTKFLKDLCQESIYGLLLHNPKELLKFYAEDYYAMLKDYKDLGLVEKIGVSVYSPIEAQQIIDRYDIDILQIPMNVFDQRFIPYLDKYKAKGIEIHVRSVFLQGLLLQSSSEIDPYFQNIKFNLDEFHKSCKDAGITPHKACIDFIKRHDQIDGMIVGVASLNQLQQAHEAFEAPPVRLNCDNFKVSIERIINPTLWRLTNDNTNR